MRIEFDDMNLRGEPIPLVEEMDLLWMLDDHAEDGDPISLDMLRDMVDDYMQEAPADLADRANEFLEVCQSVWEDRDWDDSQTVRFEMVFDE